MIEMSSKLVENVAFFQSFLRSRREEKQSRSCFPTDRRNFTSDAAIHAPPINEKERASCCFAISPVIADERISFAIVAHITLVITDRPRSAMVGCEFRAIITGARYARMSSARRIIAITIRAIFIVASSSRGAHSFERSRSNYYRALATCIGIVDRSKYSRCARRNDRQEARIFIGAISVPCNRYNSVRHLITRSADSSRACTRSRSPTTTCVSIVHFLIARRHRRLRRFRDQSRIQNFPSFISR